MRDDLDVIRRVAAGDVEAFRVLVERYQEPVLRLSRNMLGPTADWEDAAQETFLAAYAHLDSFDPAKAAFSTWLFSITRNRCLNLLRKTRPVPCGVLPESVESRPPDTCLHQADFYRVLDAALESLPTEQKTAFVLAEIEELPLEEIATIERTKLGTVKSRISRAKQKLRRILEPSTIR